MRSTWSAAALPPAGSHDLRVGAESVTSSKAEPITAICPSNEDANDEIQDKVLVMAIVHAGDHL